MLHVRGEEKRQTKQQRRREDRCGVVLFLCVAFFCLFLGSASTTFLTNCTLAEPFLRELVNCVQFEKCLKSSLRHLGVLDSSVLGRQQDGDS